MENKIQLVIPQQNGALLVGITRDKIDVGDTIDIPYNSISKIIDNETIVTLDKSNQQLLLYTIDGIFIKSIKVPFGLAMNVKDSIVYIGGNANGGEVCYMVDLDSEDQILQNINLPVPMAYGKAVDDILILGDKCFLLIISSIPNTLLNTTLQTPINQYGLKALNCQKADPMKTSSKGI